VEMEKWLEKPKKPKQPKKKYASQQRAVDRYLKKSWHRVGFRLHVDHDADVIEWVKRQQNVAGAFKRLARAEIAREAAEASNDTK